LGQRLGVNQERKPTIKMKASNWLWGYTRHTRTGDRTYKIGTIEASLRGIKLVSDSKYMDIELSDAEIIDLIKHLEKIQMAKKDEQKTN
jgi:hypothetical protein